ncbi:MAG: hypothetical protein JW807_06060 [Spirochaetes bacterium]|nr:hypothetical protein [Spirochaetota bacterium]
MKRPIVLIAATIFAFYACATMMGRWSESKFEKMSEKCLAENKAKEPSTEKWHNMTTKERNEKKKELDDFKKKRIELYQDLYTFKSVYLEHAERNGTCIKSECKPLEKIRLRIISGCEKTGELLPLIKAEQG